MAGTVKKQSLSHHLVLHSSHVGSRRKDGHRLSSERRCSNPCCETRTQEGAEKTTDMSRMENSNGSTFHCRLGQILLFERANAIASSLAELYLLAPNKLDLGRSLSPASLS